MKRIISIYFQMRGVDIEQFFATQQEMNDTFETGSLGYRGLTGPPTRRPSGLVARLYERMRRKSAGPTTCSSFDNPSPSPVVDALALKIQPEVMTAEPDEALTPTNPPFTVGNLPLMTCESRQSSLASSRRSSLRRQECVEECVQEPVGGDECHPIDVESSNEPVEDDLERHPREPTSEFDSDPPVAETLLPTVYVTPPPSTIFSQTSLDMPESVTTHEVFFVLIFTFHF